MAEERSPILKCIASVLLLLATVTFQKPQDEMRIAAKLHFEKGSETECSNDMVVLIRRQLWKDNLIRCSCSQLQPGNQVTQIDMIIPGAWHERGG